MTGPRITLVCAGLFFASGFTALVYQVIWQRMLAFFSGVHIYSITVIVTAFMAGLGAGSLAGGRIADRLGRRHAVLAFAACELAIGLFALASPWLFYDLIYQRLGWLAQHGLAVPAIHLAALLVPTFLMGASLPLLSRGLVTTTRGAARTIGLLYGVNTLGASLGALSAAWYLIGALGFASTVRLAGFVNIAIAAAAVWVVRRPENVKKPDIERARRCGSGPSTRPELLGLWNWCAIYAASGFVALSFEIVWFRVLDVTIKSSPYTFGHLLGIFLGFLALGSLAGTAWAPKLRRPDLVFLWGQWGVSFAAGAALVVLATVPFETLGWEQLVNYWTIPTGIEMAEMLWAWEHLGERRATYLLLRFARVYVTLPLFLVALPTFLMGFTFPCIQRVVQTDLRVIGWRVGAIQTSNIAGSILGSLVTGALLLDLLGTPRAIALLTVAGTLFTFLLLQVSGGGKGRIFAAVAALASVVVAFTVPSSHAFWARLHGAPQDEIGVAEDASGVAAMQTMHPLVALRLNGKGHAMLPYADYPLLFGLVPALMHPKPESVFVLGLGTGRTVWALGSPPSVTRMDVYEIVEPELQVLERATYLGKPYPPLVRLLSDPRVHVQIGDGRLALRMTDERYDLIETDAMEASMSYSGTVYSREFFELCRSRLAPGGLFVSFAPTERTLRTVAAVFPYVLDFHTRDFASFVVGSETPVSFDRAKIANDVQKRWVKRHLEASSEPNDLNELIGRFMEQVTVRTIDATNREHLVPGDVNTDLYPRDEFDKTYDKSYQ